jgi:hypothetical protein
MKRSELSETERRELIARAFGMWRRREDLPDFAALRQEFDRKEARPLDLASHPETPLSRS